MKMNNVKVMRHKWGFMSVLTVGTVFAWSNLAFAANKLVSAESEVAKDSLASTGMNASSLFSTICAVVALIFAIVAACAYIRNNRRALNEE